MNDCSISCLGRALWLGIGLAALVGCREPSGPERSAATPVATVRPVVDPATLSQGKTVYTRHCAVCHGDRAQGAPHWERPGPDGRYPPPPLDGSAHAWHHPYANLTETIRDGTQRLGGSMPPWGEKLSSAEIAAVIAWFQSTWPDEIYQAWAEIDRRSAQRTGR